MSNFQQPSSAVPGGASRAFTASIWAVGGRATSKVIDLMTLLVLARLLTPADFGLVAKAMIAVVIVEAVLELPVATSILRLTRPGPAVFATAMTLGLLRGVLVAVVLIGLAWPLAMFFDDPRLVSLIAVLALAPALRGAISPSMILFVRAFNMRPEVTLEVACKAAASIAAITVAALSGSHWAIAVATVTTPALWCFGSYFIAPQPLRLTLRRWRVFQNLLTWSTPMHLLSAVNWQLDRIVLGRQLEPAALGRYTAASDLCALPSVVIAQALHRPFAAALASRPDPAARSHIYLSAVSLVLLLTAPVYAFLIAVPEVFVNLVLGPKWEGTEDLVRWLAIAGALQAPTMCFGALGMICNRSEFGLGKTVLELGVRVPLLLIGVSLYGLWGGVAAQVAVGLVALVFVIWASGRLLGRSCLYEWRLWWRALVVFVTTPMIGFLAAELYRGSASLLSAAVYCGLLAGYVVVLAAVLWIGSGRPTGPERYLADFLGPRLRRLMPAAG